MSALRDAIEAVREALRLVDEVRRVAERIGELTQELREIDRRVARLEGKWEAAMDIGRVSAVRRLPRAPRNKAEG
ncbi:MAG: hypothetical protein NZ524_00315 [Thiobacillaceae bacterium]|nr:hypothetical protein [Thiobacillaceae bacterium]